MKPYEVELCVAEVGDTSETDQLYRLTFDGSIVDEPDFVVMGGQAEAVTGHLREHFRAGMGLSDALQVGVRALSAVSPVTAGSGNGSATLLTAAQLEVAVLDRRRPKRAFRRVVGAALRTLLGDEGRAADRQATEGATAAHAPSVSEPGTPPGLGDPAKPDTAGGTEHDGNGTDGGLHAELPGQQGRRREGARADRRREVRRHHRVVRRRAVGRRRERRDREARLRGLRRLAPRRSTPTPPRRPRAGTSSRTATSRRSTGPALIHGKQRAAQNDHDEIEKAADGLLQHLDEKRGRLTPLVTRPVRQDAASVTSGA